MATVRSYSGIRSGFLSPSVAKKSRNRSAKNAVAVIIGAAEHRLHPGRRSGLCRSVLLRPAGFLDPEYRPDRRARRALDAGLRQLGGVLGDATRADHGSLSIPVAARPGGAARRQDRCRAAAGAADLGVVAAAQR